MSTLSEFLEKELNKAFTLDAEVEAIQITVDSLQETNKVINEDSYQEAISYLKDLKYKIDLNEAYLKKIGEVQTELENPNATLENAALQKKWGKELEEARSTVSTNLDLMQRAYESLLFWINSLPKLETSESPAGVDRESKKKKEREKEKEKTIELDSVGVEPVANSMQNIQSADVQQQLSEKTINTQKRSKELNAKIRRETAGVALPTSFFQESGLHPSDAGREHTAEVPEAILEKQEEELNESQYKSAIKLLEDIIKQLTDHAEIVKEKSTSGFWNGLLGGLGWWNREMREINQTIVEINKLRQQLNKDEMKQTSLYMKGLPSILVQQKDNYQSTGRRFADDRDFINILDQNYEKSRQFIKNLENPQDLISPPYEGMSKKEKEKEGENKSKENKGEANIKRGQSEPRAQSPKVQSPQGGTTQQTFAPGDLASRARQAGAELNSFGEKHRIEDAGVSPPPQGGSLSGTGTFVVKKNSDDSSKIRISSALQTETYPNSEYQETSKFLTNLITELEHYYIPFWEQENRNAKYLKTWYDKEIKHGKDVLGDLNAFKKRLNSNESEQNKNLNKEIEDALWNTRNQYTAKAFTGFGSDLSNLLSEYEAKFKALQDVAQKPKPHS